MKLLRSLFVALGFFVATPAAFAVPRAITGTVDSPAVLAWVNTAGVEVGPYNNINAYIDPATGFAWGMINITSSTPQVTTIDYLRQYFATANCSGTVYAAFSPSTGFGGTAGAAIMLADGAAYAAVGTPVSSTIIQSEWTTQGTCTAPTAIPANFVVYAVTGPLTPPTLPAGPYHIELR